MNKEKLERLKAKGANAQLGGKGTPRRKHKNVHRSTGGDDKKLQSVLKKLQINPIPGIENVTFIKDTGIQTFKNPKVGASVQRNTFVIQGASEEKSLQQFYADMLSSSGFASNPELLAQLAQAQSQAGGDADDIPDLVESFEDTANKN